MNYVCLIFEKFLPICNTASAKENPLSSKVWKASKDVPAGENKTTAEEQLDIQRKDLALRAQKLMNDMKVHEDKMDLEESKLMIDDENKDEDRKLKEAQMGMDAAADMTSNIEGIINTTVRRG